MGGGKWGWKNHGFSKERRLEPQVTIGLLTGQDGFPLMVSAFETSDAVKLSSCLWQFRGVVAGKAVVSS